MALNPDYIHHTPVLDLQELIHIPDGKVRAEIQLQLSDLSFFGQHPIQEGVDVRVEIANRGGALMLEGEMKTQLHSTCDRCQCSFDQEKIVPLSHLLAHELEDEEHDEIILLEGNSLNLADYATTAFILEMDTKTLCSEACKGLCTRCGANLNETDCSCLAENNSPFAILASLLDD